MGGADKPLQPVGGVAMVDRVLAAVVGAARRIVVGPAVPLATPAIRVQEEPPGGGPVAAVAAALPLVEEPVTLLLAADLPFVGPAVPLLRAALDTGRPAVALADRGGRLNYLAAAWWTTALRRAVAGVGDPSGTPMRALGTPVAVPDGGSWGDDCDTPEKLSAARLRAVREEQE